MKILVKSVKNGLRLDLEMRLRDDKKIWNKYQREWVAKRRADFFKDKKCVQCGSTERLELDHIDRETKESHSIWSWSEVRRLAEIAKCQVLCHECHRLKTRKENSKLTEEQVRQIRYLYGLGNTTHRKLAKLFNIDNTKICHIVNRKYWKDI